MPHHDLAARGKSEHLGERLVAIHQLAFRRGPVDGRQIALEQQAVALFGAAQSLVGGALLGDVLHQGSHALDLAGSIQQRFERPFASDDAPRTSGVLQHYLHIFFFGECLLKGAGRLLARPWGHDQLPAMPYRFIALVAKDFFRRRVPFHNLRLRAEFDNR